MTLTSNLNLEITRTRTRNPSWVALTIMLVALIAVFAPVLYKATTHSDFQEHIRFAFNFKQTGELVEVPHFVFHVMVIVFSELLPNASTQIYSWLTVMIPTIALGMGIFVVLHRTLTTVTSNFTWLAILLTISVMVIAPIMVFYPRGCMECLLGYVNPTVYHNPTQNVAKVWFIPASFFALCAIKPITFRNQQRRVGFIILAAGLIMLMTFSKPNYTITLLPGLGLFVLYRLLKRQPVDWPLLIFGLGIPAIGVVAFQYLTTYTVEKQSSVGIGWFTFLQGYNIPLWEIPFRTLLSAAFPITVYILYFDKAHRDTYLNLSWLVLFVGLIYMYFFYETGERMGHGNFLWGSYSALFVLMFTSILFMIREFKTYRTTRRQGDRLPARLITTSLIFELQVLFGIAFWVGFQVLL